MINPERHHRRPPARRAFTLIEVLLAGVITALVVSSVSVTVGKLARAKSVSRDRIQGHLRADFALNNLRRDLISVIRSEDLFQARVLLFDDTERTPYGEMDRDEIVVFNTRLRPVRNTDHFTGEGIEYETQYRVSADERGDVLWQRRDTFPDENPLGGGKATPLTPGIIALSVEAYDGNEWLQEWDSDELGMPHALRVMIAAVGEREDGRFDERPVDLRTVISIDRILAPRDVAEAEELALRELEAQEAAEAAGASGQSVEDGTAPVQVDTPDGRVIIETPDGNRSRGGGSLIPGRNRDRGNNENPGNSTGSTDRRFQQTEGGR